MTSILLIIMLNVYLAVLLHFAKNLLITNYILKKKNGICYFKINNQNSEIALFSILESMMYQKHIDKKIMIECDHLTLENQAIVKKMLKKINYTVQIENNNMKYIELTL